MNIAFICPSLYPCSVGGMEIFNYHLIKRMSRNHNISVITGCEININDTEYILIRKQRPQIVFVPLQILFNILKHRKKIDIVHISYSRTRWSFWLIFPFVNICFKIPFMMTIHGGSFHEWKPKWPYIILFKYAKVISAVSKRACEEYQKRAKRKIHYTPPLIPLVKSKINTEKIKKIYQIPVESKIILYVGSIKPLKSTETLLDAFVELGERYIAKEKLYLVIAGAGKDKNHLEQKRDKLNIKKRIRFLGNIKHEKINDLYKIADIYVITSHFENLPISILKAMFN